MLIYAVTIFISAFLLFLVQPIIAKQILPWFGGSAAVWTTCLVFFQCTLFAGYAYADWVIRRFPVKRQAIVHVVLLAASLICLPIVAGVDWKPAGGDDPSWSILGLLAVTIGLPYFLLSTTGPLIQAWFARGYPLPTVYRLYALSNLASLLALLAYPFLIEPWVTTLLQAQSWSMAYFLFVVVCSASAVLSVRQKIGIPDNPAQPVSQDETHAPTISEQLTWLLFSGMGALMLLAVTNHITHDLASVPFLWILPLSLYLVTFILCFEGRNWYQRKYFLLPLLIAVGAMAWTLNEVSISQVNLKMAIPLSLAGLFVICMFFHGELAARKPAPRYLTRFYLMMSLGGALGGLTVGLLAVKIFNANYEYGFGLVLTLLIATLTVRRMRWFVPVLAASTTAFAAQNVYAYRSKMQIDSLELTRNFYGSLLIRDVRQDEAHRASRRLIHGVIIHGEQFHAADRVDEPTTYYRSNSGVGRALATLDQPNRRIGVVGLGAGNLAAYGRPGDVMRFYEINPQVVTIAQEKFSFLSRSKAQVETVLGDARLVMEGEANQQYDLLIIDAFSSDSIPVHLATAEAFQVYLRHLKPGGVIAFHISNKFLRLDPLLKRLADRENLDSMVVADRPVKEDDYFSEWLLMTADRTFRQHPSIMPAISEPNVIPDLQPWTDDFNNLYQILR